MNYIPLEQLKNAWIFKHKSLLIDELDKSKIKPMTPSRAQVVWDTFISNQVDHPDFFKKGDWPFDKSYWLEQGKWENIWDSNEQELPELISKHIHDCLKRNDPTLLLNLQLTKLKRKNSVLTEENILL